MYALLLAPIAPHQRWGLRRLWPGDEGGQWGVGGASAMSSPSWTSSLAGIRFSGRRHAAATLRILMFNRGSFLPMFFREQPHISSEIHSYFSPRNTLKRILIKVIFPAMTTYSKLTILVLTISTVLPAAWPNLAHTFFRWNLAQTTNNWNNASTN